MITKIYIKNFILIDELDLPLSPGFTAITGETGAGKSILIGAISMILGARADFKTLRPGADKAIIEAECDIQGIEGLEALFQEHNLDYAPLTTLRRELTSTGKSRAFINDTPVTTTLLRQVGEQLVDIHSQHHNMLIGESHYQMSVLDTLASNTPLLHQYQTLYTQYQNASKQLQEERTRIAEQKKEQDYLQFQYQQLLDANLRAGELPELEERYATARHSLEITEVLALLATFNDAEYDQAPSLLSQITQAIKGLESVAPHFSAARTMAERLTEVRIELNELIREAEHLSEGLELNPRQMEQLEERIDLLNNLLAKHHLETDTQLTQLRDHLAQQLSAIEHSDQHLQELEQQLQSLQEQATQKAEQLSQRRQTAAQSILPQIHPLMKELGIAGATFQVELTPLPQLTPSGKDQVQFLFATNKKTSLQPIREIASGGEISRFMLALKCILSEHALLPTVIFDEIDSGVSGEVAEKLGKVMARMGQHLQVLSITHLPQIAALAPHHLLVAKEEGNAEYTTHIRTLTHEERIEEIAAMLSGSKLTQAAKEHARTLLSTSQA